MNIIKSVIKSISKRLVYICNLSLSAGIFPDDMKIARVIPLYKARENDLINLFPNMTFDQIVSMVLGKICQLILLY